MQVKTWNTSKKPMPDSEKRGQIDADRSPNSPRPCQVFPHIKAPWAGPVSTGPPCAVPLAGRIRSARSNCADRLRPIFACPPLSLQIVAEDKISSQPWIRLLIRGSSQRINRAIRRLQSAGSPCHRTGQPAGSTPSVRAVRPPDRPLYVQKARKLRSPPWRPPLPRSSHVQR